MRIGLIARADNSGLGNQTWEFFRHMEPAKTLVIDVGHLSNGGSHCNKATFVTRYPKAMRSIGWHPTPNTLRQFLVGLDVVFSAETPYDYRLFTLADQMGVRSVLQYNWEFFDYLKRTDLPAPTMFASPSTWHYSDVPHENKCLMPVPIATDRFTPREHGETATSFLHVVGRPAAHDRNGTLALLSCLQHITANVTVTIRSQLPGYVNGLMAAHQIRTPDNVTLVVHPHDITDYWQLYDEGDVLIMPRRFGGLCLPAQEAIGAGMPVIMPSISPNIDWLPADWLVDATLTGAFNARSSIALYSTSEHALAAKIDQFATDAAFYTDAQTKVADIASQLSWANMRPKYDRILSDLTR